MSLRRLRTGEWLASLSAAGLLVLLFADWFTLSTGDFDAFGDGVSRSGFESLGVVYVALLLILIGMAFALAAFTVMASPVAWPIATAVWLSAYGILLWLPLLLRIVLFQPDFGVGLPDDVVGVEPAAYAGLVLAALIPFGSWRTMADERKDSPESRYTPPPARPIPGHES